MSNDAEEQLQVGSTAEDLALEETTPVAESGFPGEVADIAEDATSKTLEEPAPATEEEPFVPVPELREESAALATEQEQEEQLPAVPTGEPPARFVHKRVLTTFGEGFVRELRPDGMFVVSLVGWRLAHGKYPTAIMNIDQLKERHYLLMPEVLEEANEQKDLARALFEQKDYEAAAAKYQHVIYTLAQSLNSIKLKGKDFFPLSDRLQIAEMWIKVDINIAICCNSNDRPYEAIRWCNDSLERNQENRWPESKAKALFHRGKANLMVHSYDSAIKDLTAAYQLATSINDVTCKTSSETVLKKAKAARQQWAAKQRKAYSGAFDDPDSKTNSTAAPAAAAAEQKPAAAASAAAVGAAPAAAADAEEEEEGEEEVEVVEVEEVEEVQEETVFTKRNMVFGAAAALLFVGFLVLRRATRKTRA